MALAMAGASNKLWYTNSEILLMQYNFMSELFLIESKKNSIKQELSKETKKIGDYTCYKANCILKNIGNKGLGEKKVEVWFTKEIPIQLGPVGLTGLPGLILEANFFKVSYVASNIKLNVEGNVEIKKPQKGRNIKDADFFEMASQKVKDFREGIKKQKQLLTTKFHENFIASFYNPAFYSRIFFLYPKYCRFRQSN